MQPLAKQLDAAAASREADATPGVGARAVLLPLTPEKTKPIQERLVLGRGRPAGLAPFDSSVAATPSTGTGRAEGGRVTDTRGRA